MTPFSMVYRYQDMKRKNHDRTGQCKLCGRSAELTFHHLIPKKVQRRTYFAAAYSREDLSQGIYICSLCHHGIHDLYDEMTIAKHYCTLKDLRRDPAVHKHAAWVRKQKAT